MSTTGMPTVLFVDIFSPGKFSSENLITTLLNSELGETSENSGDKSASAFERLLGLQTKYYTATVKLDWVGVGSCLAVEIVNFWRNSVEAVILNGADADFEFTKEIHEKADQLLNSVESDSSELLKLLVVSCVSWNEDVETKALKWCAGRGVELVELNPTEEKIEELKNCRELYGLERVKQALKSHSWSNAVALGEQHEFLNDLNALKRKEEARENVDVSKEKALVREQFFDGKTGGAELDEAKFEELFEKFAELKAKAGELPPGEERKEYAAEVATAFYEALVGAEQSDDDEQ